jgi:hypothetical protein
MPSLSKIAISCSVVINVVFNTRKPLSIDSERAAKSKRMRENYRCGSYLFQIIWGELYENCHYRIDFSFEVLNIKAFEITR